MMTQWAVFGVLTVEDVVTLPIEVLRHMTDISTNIVQMRVNEFINNNINSNDEMLKKAALILKEIYDTMNKRKEYLESDEIKESISILGRLQYSDIGSTTSIESLNKFEYVIKGILSEKELRELSYTNEEIENRKDISEFAYVPRYDNENLQSTIQAMINESENFGQSCFKSTLMLTERIKSMKKIFISPDSSSRSSNSLKSVMARKDTLKNILIGIRFIMDSKKKGDTSAEKWRQC